MVSYQVCHMLSSASFACELGEQFCAVHMGNMGWPFDGVWQLCNHHLYDAARQSDYCRRRRCCCCCCCRLHYFAKAFNPTKTTLVDTVSRSKWPCCCSSSCCLLQCQQHCTAQYVKARLLMMATCCTCISWFLQCCMPFHLYCRCDFRAQLLALTVADVWLLGSPSAALQSWKT
jgi:hypothetical protein